MNTLRKGIIVVSGLILFLLFFFIAPIISFSCSNGLFTTTGSVSLSCETLGFGEIYESALGIAEYGWSDNCQIPSGPTIQCSTGLVVAPLSATSPSIAFQNLVNP